MTAKELFELSGIEQDPNFKEMDYAVPFDHERKEYPHNGRAITVYWRDRDEKGLPVLVNPEIISHYDLACSAKKTLQAKFREYMNKLGRYDSVSNEFRFETYRIYLQLEEIDEVKRSCLEMQSMEKA